MFKLLVDCWNSFNRVSHFEKVNYRLITTNINGCIDCEYNISNPNMFNSIKYDMGCDKLNKENMSPADQQGVDYCGLCDLYKLECVTW